MRHLSRFTASLVCLAAVLALSGAAFAADVAAPKELVKAGALVYGVAATFPPFEYQEGDKLVGFDIELGAAIAKKMGLKVETLNMEFKGLIPALQGKRIDIINSAMYIKPERAEQVDFIPYMQIGEEVVVKKGNPAKVKGVDDLCGRSVSVTLGAIEEIYARDFSKKCEAEKKKPIDVKTFPTAPDSALAVTQGRADAFFISTPGASHMIAQKPKDFEIVGKTFDANTQIGIAVRKGDAAMKKAVEDALKSLTKDGSFDKLLAKYKLPATGKIIK